MPGLERRSAIGKSLMMMMICGLIMIGMIMGMNSDHQDHHHLDDNSEDKDKMPRDCLIETALAEETRLEAKLLNDTEIELYKVFVLFVGFCFFLFGTHCR